MDTIIRIMLESGAASAAAIKYTDCDIINPRLANKIPFKPQSTFIGTIPYYTRYCDNQGAVSAYAIAYDYHNYIKHLGETIIEKLQKIYPQASFVCFGDHSPINEKLAAAKAGLGIIGEHSLLITPLHSSFVFLFEIISDLECQCAAGDILLCEKCGRCKNACPADFDNKQNCLSALTQKKGVLTEQESELIATSACAWGCDICQRVCPHTLTALKTETIYTQNEWFNSNVLLSPNKQSVADTDDFKSRAYSWRGEATILRNLELIKSKTDGTKND